jgi:ATP-binding cassette subfamily B protein/ATP-binding cassette subfamily C protein
MSIPLTQYWSLLVNYLRPQRPRVIVLAALLLGSIGLQIANPQILRYFIDTARAGGEMRALIEAALLFIGVALVNQVLSVGATYVGENVGWTATNALRADLTLHCLRLDLGFHKARTPGELIERIDGDVTALANFFSQFVVKVLGNLLLLIGVLAVLFAEDWRVGAAMATFALLALITLLRFQRIAVPYWRKARQASAELFGFVEERLAGTEDIRSSGATDYTLRRLYQHSRERLHEERRANLIGSITWATPILFFGISVGMAFVLGDTFVRAGTMTLGTAYLLFFYAELLIRPLMLITRQMEDLQKASAGIVRVRELYAARSPIQDGPGAALPDGPLSVAFEQVAFAYNDDRPRIEDSDLPSSILDPLSSELVLGDISFQLAPGQVLGVLGRSGSGKTTLTRLLFRLYDPDQGAIRLGGVDIRAARLAELRGRIGMVTQDVQLFHASVRDNLTFFDPAIPDERILRALDDLGLNEWYAALPDGLDTLLAAGGQGLSAGEAQILAFTRVFLRDPGLIILDEASSRLDPATERLTERAVDRLLHANSARRTGIIIAHRLATVQRADAILILEDGRIREYGAREQLLGDPGSRFAQLLRTGMEEVLV